MTNRKQMQRLLAALPELTAENNGWLYGLADLGDKYPKFPRWTAANWDGSVCLKSKGERVPEQYFD